MKIGRMKEGGLYEIKTSTILEKGSSNSKSLLPVLKGWRDSTSSVSRPPFLYLGWKQENWIYSHQNTSKIHYILWKELIWVMDNQFAKHIMPLWDGDSNG
jgi:hypothetical protein